MPPENVDPQVANIAVRPPPFWKTNPALWFARLEAQFALGNISVDSTKFNFVLSVIDSDILHSVSNLVLSPPAKDKYEAIKARLIELHSESDASKIRTLLQGLELGDQRPSQLLSRMRSLAGDSVGEPFLKSLWLERLPSNTQAILVSHNEELDKLAAVADKINDLAPCGGVNSVAASAGDETAQLRLQVSQLSQQVSELTAMVRRSRSPGRSPKHSQNRSNSGNRFRKYLEPANGYCFYHTNFGRNAKKCVPPCSFGSGN